MNYRLKDVLRILNKNNFNHAKSDFINESITLNFDSERSKEKCSSFTQAQLMLPVTAVKILIGRSLVYLDLDDEEVSPTVKSFENRAFRFASPYSDCKTYGIGDTCVYKNKLYICKSTFSKHSFDKNYWDQIDPLYCEIEIDCIDVSDKYVMSSLYELDILKPYIFRVLSKFHNSVLSEECYKKGIKHFNNKETLCNELTNLMGFTVKISRAESRDEYYVIYDPKLHKKS